MVHENVTNITSGAQMECNIPNGECKSIAMPAAMKKHGGIFDIACNGMFLLNTHSFIKKQFINISLTHFKLLYISTKYMHSNGK